MTFRSLVSMLSADAPEASAVAYAERLADHFDAHLDILATAENHVSLSASATELGPATVQTGMTEAIAAAKALARKTGAAVEDPARIAVHTVVALDALLKRELFPFLRFADLGVMPAPYGPRGCSALVEGLETALFDAGLPVIVTPADTQFAQPKRVVLAWNNGDEALRAARTAIPLLTGADTVFITVIDPPQHGPDRSDPGGMLAQMLARHGVRCEIDVLAKSLPRVSDVILRQLSDRDADMLVMGAYGRARWSEAMFGGATRHMLEEVPVPMFMAH